MANPYQSALLDELDPSRRAPYLPPNGNTGITGGIGGGLPPLQPEPAPAAAEPQKPAPIQYGSTLGNAGYLDMGGINAEKLNSPHNSPKYQVLRALSHFDPAQGITGDVLTALNSLGLGQFSGSGDKLTVANADPRFEGWTDIDTIVDYAPGAAKNRWSYGSTNPNLPAQQGVPRTGTIAPNAGTAMNGMLSGDPMAAITAALAKYAQPSMNLQALLQQLQG